jgi:thiamine-monophosphate kinase
LLVVFLVHPFTSSPAASVSALGERALITAIRRWLGTASPPAPQGIGDDCAVLAPSRYPQLVTVDPVIYGEHFNDSIPPRAVAAKLLKRNLSDLAAMGAQPRAAVVALALAPNVSTRWLEAFYRGLARTSRSYLVPIVGGDIARHTGGLVATLTLIGEARGPRALTRTGTRSGDWIYVTGALGGSLPSGRHHRFTPRLAEGAWLAARPEVRAMLDISDGLAKDLPALAPRQATAWINPTAVPRHRGCDLRAALEDGEDYELVFTVAARTNHAAFAAAWANTFQTRLTCIGCFANRAPAGYISLQGFHGYEHLR